MATAKKTRTSYDESNVRVLQFPESVREAPTLQIGPLGEEGVFTIARETADNVVDEALQGRCTALYMHVDTSTNVVTVMDNGAGIPVGLINVTDVMGKTHRVSALRSMTGMLQSSAKFDNKAYETARGCFAGDTKVRLLSGEIVTMEDLYQRWQRNKSPIAIMSFNLETQKLEPSYISHAQITKLTTDLVEITLDSGEKVRVTPDHPFYVNRVGGGISKVRAENLESGHSLVSAYYSKDEDGDQVRFLREFNHQVRSVTRLTLPSPVPVYDITVDRTHVFFINPGVLVSNSHGIGIKATNALSLNFTVHTYREGKWYAIAYKKGNVTVDVTKTAQPPINPVSHKPMVKGTWIQFKPDASILGTDKLPLDLMYKWAEIATYFTPGLGILIANQNGPKGELRTKKFFAADGPVAFIRKQLKLNSAELLAPSSGEDPLAGAVFETSNPLIDCAMTFTSLSVEVVSAHTNGLLNANGGTHLNAFYKALEAALAKFLKRGQTINARSLKEGVVGLINAKLSRPKFSSQDKVKLTDDRISDAVVETLTQDLVAFFKKNRALAEAVIEQAMASARMYETYKLGKEASRNIKKIVSLGFPSKAQIAPNCKPEERELFVVEGDSAGGCFSADTLVKTTVGDIRFDELAARAAAGETFAGRAFDLSHGGPVTVPLLEPRVTKYVDELVELTLEDGTVVSCTPDHLWLLTNGEYRAAKDLTPDDDIQT